MMKKIAGWIAIEEFGSRPARNRRLEFFFFSPNSSFSKCYLFSSIRYINSMLDEIRSRLEPIARSIVDSYLAAIVGTFGPPTFPTCFSFFSFPFFVFDRFKKSRKKCTIFNERNKVRGEGKVEKNETKVTGWEIWLGKEYYLFTRSMLPPSKSLITINVEHDNIRYINEQLSVLSVLCCFF